jgi:hypothetical protein
MKPETLFELRTPSAAADAPRTLDGLIYEPSGRAREYAALACNIYRGCDHGCTYCYAPSATHRTRTSFACSEPRGDDFLKRLEKEAGRRPASATPPILLCFTCDPYQLLDARLGLTREAIKILHAAGHAVHVLTKGGTRALRDLDLFAADRDRSLPPDANPASGYGNAFATTLTLLDDRWREWEPGAASPMDRLEAIQAYHAAGVPTWVSLEPVLDPEAALGIIRETAPYVDLFKVGRLNYHPLAAIIDWRAFGLAAITALEALGKPYYIKRDLAEALPPDLAPSLLRLMNPPGS